MKKSCKSCLIGMFVMVGLSLASGSAWSITVFQPTNQSVNFLNFGPSTSTILGIFDDSDGSYTGSYLAIDANGDEAFFNPTIGQNTNYSLTNNTGLAPSSAVNLLTGNDNFIVGLSTDGTGNSGTWIAPTEPVVCNGANSSCTLSWTIGTTVIAVDLELAPIPIPASVWLLGSGLLGLAGIARRKKIA